MDRWAERQALSEADCACAKRATRANLAAAHQSDNQLDLFCIGGDGAIWVWFVVANGVCWSDGVAITEVRIVSPGRSTGGNKTKRLAVECVCRGSSRHHKNHLGQLRARDGSFCLSL